MAPALELGSVKNVDPSPTTAWATAVTTTATLRRRSRSAIPAIVADATQPGPDVGLGLERAVGPEQAAGPRQGGGEGRSLGVGEAADEVDDAPSASHPGQLGVAGPPVQPLRVGLRDPLVPVRRGGDQVEQPPGRASGVAAVGEPVVEAGDEMGDGAFLPA